MTTNFNDTPDFIPKSLLIAACVALCIASTGTVLAMTTMTPVKAPSNSASDRPPSERTHPDNSSQIDDANHSDAATNEQDQVPSCSAAHNCETGTGAGDQKPGWRLK